MLYLFGGPRRDDDGFPYFCSRHSIACDIVDVEFDHEHDLVDQHVWEQLRDKLHTYDAFLLSPPCSTFTPARNSEDGGPRPLRTPTGNGRYGCKGLTIDEKEQVKVGTLLALRAHEVAQHAQQRDKPWILEQPHWRTDQTSMFTLDEFQSLLQFENVNIFTFAQCRFGCDAEKLTDLLSNRDLSSFERLCNHEARWWTIPWNGKSQFTPHPPLKGRQKAIPSEQWNSSMLRNKEPAGPYITRAYAAYPSQLNEALAEIMSSFIQEQVMEFKQENAQRVSQDNMLDTKLEHANRLKPLKQGRVEATDEWSLRNVNKSMTGRSLLIGKQIANLIKKKVGHQPRSGAGASRQHW